MQRHHDAHGAGLAAPKAAQTDESLDQLGGGVEAFEEDQGTGRADSAAEAVPDQQAARAIQRAERLGVECRPDEARAGAWYLIRDTSMVFVDGPDSLAALLQSLEACTDVDAEMARQQTLADARSMLCAPRPWLNEAKKQRATAGARAALIGAVLVDSQDDQGRSTWILTRWSLTREFSRLDDVARVLDAMGAPS